MRGRRRTVVYAGAAVVLIAALALLFAGGPGAEGTARRPTTDAVPAPAPPPQATSPTPSPGAAEPVTVLSAIQPGTPARPRPALPPGGVGRLAADDYRRRARYPHSSEPLVAGPDPIEQERQVTPITQRGPQGEDPSLTVFPAESGFESPEPAVMYAYLSINGGRVPAAQMYGTLLTEDLQPVGTLQYRDDGTGGDAEAGDGLYTAVVTPGPEAADVLSRSYLVQVVGVTLANVERRAASSFLYSNPQAHLTGRYRDALVDGSLVVGAEVDVLAEGRFHLEATLYSKDGSQLLARAQTAAVLTPGEQWMELPFYGLVLRERGVEGPYLLRWMALSTTTQMPNAKNRLVDAGYHTGSYALAAFTDQPFNDPALLDAAARMERDQGALGGLDAGG